MKFVFALVWLATPTFALAADYSGCNLVPPKPPGKAEYLINVDGTLAMNRKAPDVVSAETSDEKDVLVTKSENGPVRVELMRKNGMPTSLTTVYAPYGAKNPNRATNVRNFSYVDGRCVMTEQTLRYSHGPDARKTVVTYNRDLCREAAAEINRSGSRVYECLSRIADKLPLGKECQAEAKRARTFLYEYNRSWERQGKSIFAFNEKDTVGSLNVLEQTAMNCGQTEAMYQVAMPVSSGIGGRIRRFFEGGSRGEPRDPAGSSAQ